MGQTRTDGPGQVYRVDSRRQLKRLPRLDRIPQFSYSTLNALLGGIGVNSMVRPGANRAVRKGW